jgi:hypothetical protein
VTLSWCVYGPSSDGQDLRAARWAVEDPVGQDAHLGMAALAGVGAQGIEQADNFPEGLKRGTRSPGA